MNAHTPGPWTIRHNEYEKDSYILAENKEFPVCLIGETHYFNNSEINKANALLISTAPELLEALEGIVKKIDELGLDFEDNGRIAKAKAAITKATGEK